MLTYHEPQMKYWTNMNAESLILREVCTGGGEMVKGGAPDINAERQCWYGNGGVVPFRSPGVRSRLPRAFTCAIRQCDEPAIKSRHGFPLRGKVLTLHFKDGEPIAHANTFRITSHAH